MGELTFENLDRGFDLVVLGLTLLLPDGSSRRLGDPISDPGKEDPAPLADPDEERTDPISDPDKDGPASGRADGPASGHLSRSHPTLTPGP